MAGFFSTASDAWLQVQAGAENLGHLLIFWRDRGGGGGGHCLSGHFLVHNIFENVILALT